jgi:hypothetical protein
MYCSSHGEKLKACVVFVGKCPENLSLRGAAGKIIILLIISRSALGLVQFAISCLLFPSNDVSNTERHQNLSKDSKYIIISSPTVLVRTSAISHWRFRNLIRRLVRTSLDKWSARRRGLYLHRTTQHRNTKQTSMPRAGFKATTPVTKRKTYSLESGHRDRHSKDE